MGIGIDRTALKFLPGSKTNGLDSISGFAL
jgi:hypothetical protein